MLTPADIERRLPLWVALSDLFLDTQLQPTDHRIIAAVLRVSGYAAVSSQDEGISRLSSDA